MNNELRITNNELLFNLYLYINILKGKGVKIFNIDKKVNIY